MPPASVNGPAPAGDRADFRSGQGRGTSAFGGLDGYRPCPGRLGMDSAPGAGENAHVYLAHLASRDAGSGA
jgi:hypothetical protein